MGRYPHGNPHVVRDRTFLENNRYPHADESTKCDDPKDENQDAVHQEKAEKTEEKLGFYFSRT